jgi:hypothetical protein
MNVNPNDLVFLADDDDDKMHGRMKKMRPDPMAGLAHLSPPHY